MIRRLQPGYHPIGVLHSKEADIPKIRFCSRCEEGFGVQVRLGPRILGIGESRPPDYDHWTQCSNCGTVYAKHETKVEPELSPIKEPSDGKQAKSQGIEKRKKRTGRGSNSRLKGNKWEIKDEELKAELNSGSVLLAYSSNDPTEPTV
jgi:ribosomal protein S27AE